MENKATCSTCGNHYHKCFEVIKDDHSYTFDCFECAIHKLAPVCAHCQCKIIGHGIEANNHYYCCAHCTKESGITQAKNHV